VFLTIQQHALSATILVKHVLDLMTMSVLAVLGMLTLMKALAWESIAITRHWFSRYFLLRDGIISSLLVSL